MGTLRFVNSTSGMNVRDTAAGNIITRLNYGDLMYEIDPIPVQRALDGVVYYWKWVYFYKSPNTTLQGYGWVAEQYTLEVPANIPTYFDVISNNQALTQHQSLVNARYIFQYLRNQGWSLNSIYGMLGNMEHESYINPGKLENNPSTPPGGFGLVQWTPATNYTSWLPQDANPGDINNQLSRILYEVNNNLQWISTLHSPTMSFSQFTHSTNSPENLAEYFCRCYERPGEMAACIVKRRGNANKWATLLDIIDF